MSNQPIILIILDQLNSLKNIDLKLLDSLEGIKKFKSRSIYFTNHYTTTVPCSASRSVIYTGVHTNKTKVTDNVEFLWQKSLSQPSKGLDNIGSYLKKNNYKTRYIGKFHLLKDLVPDNTIKYKPRLATNNDLQKYDFDKFNKYGDYCFDTRVAYGNDKLVTEQVLPNGTVNTECDYYDETTKTGYDGTIPYLKNQNIENPFLLCVNYDNPHDVLYTNIKTNINFLKQISIQIDGLRNPVLDTVSNYNENFRMFSDLDLKTINSYQLDNTITSFSNVDTLSIGLLFKLLAKYYYYGIEFADVDQYLQYQTSYYRCIKQVDDELIKIYNYLEENNYFDTAVICLTSDHGEYCGAHGLLQKGSVYYEEAFNVPLFISYPNMDPKLYNTESSIITSHVNLLPTLLQLANIDPSQYTNLQSSIFDNNYNIIDKDYQIIKLNLSIGFGPLLYYLCKSFDIPEINYYLEEKLENKNYITIPGFSISSIIKLDNVIYNCGYLFSIYHVYFETIKYITDINIYNKDELFILYDEDYSFAFIGKKRIIHFQAYTDPFIYKNFKKPMIDIFNQNTSPYIYYVGTDPIYGTRINCKNETDKLNKSINNITNDINDYAIVGNENNIIWIGPYSILELLIEYDPIIKSYTSNPTIINLNQIDPNLLKDKINILHPLSSEISIYIDKNLPIIIELYGDLNGWGLVFNNISESKNYIIVQKLINGSYFIINYIYSVLYNSNQNNLLRLPGSNLQIIDLIANGYEVLITNLSEDPNELYNLADSSRIAKNIDLINNLLLKLNDNILFNKVDNIFISLPISYILDNKNLLIEYFQSIF